jgi:hypothetical protein
MHITPERLETAVSKSTFGDLFLPTAHRVFIVANTSGKLSAAQKSFLIKESHAERFCDESIAMPFSFSERVR